MLPSLLSLASIKRKKTWEAVDKCWYCKFSCDNRGIMKRKSTVNISKALNYKCPPVTLYLDDITKIIEVLNKQNAQYLISDVEYEYDSLEEIKSNCGDLIKELVIEAHFDNSFENLTLKFKRGSISLRSCKSDKLTVLWYDIKEIIERRSSWYLRVINSQIFLYTTFSILAIAWIKKPDLVAAFPDQASWLDWIIIFLSFFVSISGLSNFMYPKIYLKNKQQIRGFFRENTDKLIVGLIVGFIVLIAKIISDKFLF